MEKKYKENMILWLRRNSIEKIINITMNSNNKQNNKMRDNNKLNKLKNVHRVKQ